MPNKIRYISKSRAEQLWIKEHKMNNIQVVPYLQGYVQLCGKPLKLSNGCFMARDTRGFYLTNTLM